MYATYLVQPLDVVFNAPFKAKVEKQACQHLAKSVTPPYYMYLARSDYRLC